MTQFSNSSIGQTAGRRVSIAFIAFCVALGVGGFAVGQAFAEPAPVYDADALEQPYDSGGGGGVDSQMQTDLPPPPNQTSQDSAFIPIQSELQPIAAPSRRRGSSSSSGSSSGMERRLQRIEQQIGNIQSSDVGAQIESLQNQIQSLRAELEQLTKAMQQTITQQKSMYSDLDNRLNKAVSIASSSSSGHGGKSAAALADANKKSFDQAVNSLDAVGQDIAKPKRDGDNNNKVADADAASADAAANKPATTAPKVVANANAAQAAASGGDSAAEEPNVAEEQQIYQNAYNMIKNKKYNDAVSILQNMLHKYPNGQFASNAHYWLGELYGLMGKNDKALTEFDQVVQNFSDSPRVSDAMLKVGLIFAAQAKWNDAKNIFKKIINRYPGTASSRLANEQLKQIKQAGH